MSINTIAVTECDIYNWSLSEADGLFASGEYYMESVSVIAVMWFLTIRPLLAWSIFISTNEVSPPGG